jgi:DNA-binding CsgD family transcriptional regulator
MNQPTAELETLPEKSTSTLLLKNIDVLKIIADKLPVVVIVISMETLEVEYMSPNGLQILGFSMVELKKLGSEYLNTFFNPEDLEDYKPKIFGLLNDLGDDRFVSYFQQVRSSASHDWSWYFSTTKVFIRNDEGKPTHLITTAAPVDPVHHITSKVNRLLGENNFLKKNKHIFASLTNREKEILRFMALGTSATEIAEKLFISEDTVSTHRRNVRRKLGVQTHYDITRFAQSFDLI